MEDSPVEGSRAPRRGLPRMRVAGGLLGVIGVAIATLGAFAAVFTGILRLFIVALSDNPDVVFFSSPFLRRVVAPMVFGGLLVFVGRRLAGSGTGRAIADGLSAAILPLALAVLVVFVMLWILP